MPYDYDLFVIGAGSGGVRASRIAAGYGAKVGIAEGSRIGGTCVIRGCVPKKLFVYAGRYSEQFEDAKGFGWDVSAPTFSWENFKQKRDAEIARLEGLYTNTLNNNKVEVFTQFAKISGAHSVTLASGKTITAEKILIAVGGTPTRPNIAGIEHAIVSDDIFNLPTQPKSIVILGAGFVALEFACALAQLGTQVSVVHRGEKLLTGFDEDMRDAVLDSLTARGIKFYLNNQAKDIENKGNSKSITLTNGDVLEAETVFCALGRTPLTADLGLETVGVTTEISGAILVNEYSQTNVPSIFAVGDVTNRINLTPVAIREGHAFADTEFGKNPRIVDHSIYAKAVFTTPEIGSVGLTELEAKAQGFDVKVYSTKFRPMAATLSGRSDRVHMKLIVDTKTDIVLGCHIFAPDAGEMIQLVAIAVQMKATKAQFDATIAVHPTMAEELVTLR